MRVVVETNVLEDASSPAIAVHPVRWREALPEWMAAHVNAFSAMGGVPGAVVCDNRKAGVTTTCRYEPGINRTYQHFAMHYDTAHATEEAARHGQGRSRRPHHRALRRDAEPVE